MGEKTTTHKSEFMEILIMYCIILKQIYTVQKKNIKNINSTTNTY